MRHLHFFSLAVIAASLPVAAQQHFTLKDVVFKGETPYSPQQLQEASGLKPGQSVTPEDITLAAQKLMDSGAFRDVDPSVTGPTTGVSAIFKVAIIDSKDLLPTSIDNLVWLDPKQVTTELQHRVALFGPRLPQGGNLGTQVRDALQAMLAEKGVTYKVELVDTPSTDIVPESLHFRIQQPTIVLKSIHLDGLTAQTAPALRESLRGVVGKPYDEGSGPALDDRLLTPFRNTGYLDATVSSLTRTAEPEQAGNVGVVISGTVHPGEPYRVASITYAAAPLYSADRFAAAQKLHNGDVASQKALQESYQPLLDAYHEQGYVDARIETAPQSDRAAHTVSYTISILPGSPYTIGAVHADGLSGQAQADFEKNWRMKPGAVYNATYPRTFLRSNSALLSLHPYTALYDTKADPATHTVDLMIHFLKNNRD